MYCRYLVINELIFFSLHSIIVNFFLAAKTFKGDNKILLIFRSVRLRGVHPGSEVFHPGSQIPDPHQRI
jgi:hypothetical protein